MNIDFLNDFEGREDAELRTAEVSEVDFENRETEVDKLIVGSIANRVHVFRPN